MTDRLSTFIAGLHSADASERAASARELFAVGYTRAEAATRVWRTLDELRQLLGDPPHLTVGVAVHPETFAKIHQANGSPPLADVPPDQDAIELELHFASGKRALMESQAESALRKSHIALDILTTREPGGSGAIARFLAKQGEGIQQVEYRCRNVDRATAILQERFGLVAVYPQTRPGAAHTRINFFLVSSPDGKKVLIELYQANS